MIEVIGEEGEIIIVDDFSTDGIREVLEENIDGKIARGRYRIYEKRYRILRPHVC